MDTTSVSRLCGAQARRALLIAMPLLALAPKFWIATHALYGADLSVFNTGFGFGDYIRSLAEDGNFRSCSTLPFDPCTPGTCTFATRMPGVPLLLAALAKLVGTQSVSVALAKCVVLALLSSGFLAVLSVDVNITTLGLVILYGLYFGPQPLKHGAALDYEEGVLIDLSLCLAIAVSYLLRPGLTASPARRAAMAFAAVVIATIMYFTKTTALLTLFVVLAIVLRDRGIGVGSKLACVAVVASLAAAWAAHNLSSSGAFSVSSSWNGENLYRGYNSESLAIYPQISLDRIFDSRRAVLDNGRIVLLGAYKGSRCFSDEWAWSSTYSRMSWQWSIAHPYAAANFFTEKVWVVLVEVRHTPKYGSAIEKSEEGSAAMRAAMVGWMVAARITFFFLLGRILWDLRAARNWPHAWAIALVIAACAPYMIAFAYQRHLIPVLELAGGLLAVLYFSQPAGTARGAQGAN
jgi:hypothetical protein